MGKTVQGRTVLAGSGLAYLRAGRKPTSPLQIAEDKVAAAVTDTQLLDLIKSERDPIPDFLVRIMEWSLADAGGETGNIRALLTDILARPVNRRQRLNTILSRARIESATQRLLELSQEEQENTNQGALLRSYTAQAKAIGLEALASDSSSWSDQHQQATDLRAALERSNIGTQAECKSLCELVTCIRESLQAADNDSDTLHIAAAYSISRGKNSGLDKVFHDEVELLVKALELEACY